MSLRSPSEFYLKYLITHPDGFNNTAIREQMESYRLFTGTDKYLNSLRRDIDVPKPFRPYDLHHAPSKHLLIEEQLWGLWHPTEHVRAAKKILRAPDLQEAVHAMMTVGADDESVALLADKRYQVALSVKAVDRYRKYFWNMSLVNTAELRSVCKAVSNGNQRRDPLVLAAELPATPVSGVLVQMRLGFLPASMNYYNMLKKVAEMCTVRMYETMVMGGKEASEEFRNCAWGLKYVHEVMNTMAAPEEDLRKMMSGVRLVTKPLQTPTINQLTNGSFSDGTFVQDQDKKKE